MRGHRRLGAAAITAGIAAVLLPWGARAEPSTATALAGGFIRDMNVVRAANHLRPFAVSPELTTSAATWSARQAATGDIFHNLHMYDSLSSARWARLNENVGMGSTESDIEAAFEASPDHLANYLNPNYTDVGVGVVVAAGGGIFVTEDFGQARISLARQGQVVARPASKSTVAPSSGPTTATPHGPTAPPPRSPAPLPEPSARVRLVLEQLRALDVTR